MAAHRPHPPVTASAGRLGGSPMPAEHAHAQLLDQGDDAATRPAGRVDPARVQARQRLPECSPAQATAEAADRCANAEVG